MTDRKATDSKRVFITGGASGLGAALAKKYASHGYKVCIGDVNLERGAASLEELKKISPEAIFMACDVTQSNDFEQVAKHLEAAWGGVDIIINNAGVAGTAGGIEQVSEQDWETILNINVMGVVRGCQAFIPMMKQQKSGQIINIASAAGLMNVPLMSNYNASKSAVISISETLKGELHRFGISVSVACPSFFKTQLTESLNSHIPGFKDNVDRLMERATTSADDIALMIFNRASQQDFWIVTHKTERRLWLLKRLMPNYFHTLMKKQSKKIFARR